jgi:hypothetical protein
MRRRDADNVTASDLQDDLADDRHGFDRTQAHACRAKIS